YSSSGFSSSTSSVPWSVGSVENNCEQACSCCNVASLDLQKSHFDEEEEDQDQSGENSASQSSARDGFYDRDSALPASPALNTSTPVCYHSHSNSQCSVDSTSQDHTPNLSSSLPSTSYIRGQTRPATSSDIKIDVSEVKDGISSVQITLTGGTNSVTRPSKADLKKMKEFLLSNCNVESS